jgi:hypothetical protein
LRRFLGLGKGRKAAEIFDRINKIYRIGEKAVELRDGITELMEFRQEGHEGQERRSGEKFSCFSCLVSIRRSFPV